MIRKGKKKKPVEKKENNRIWSYFNGVKKVFADPMVLFKKIMQIGPELQVDMKVANSQMADAPKCHTAAVEKVRKVFNLKELDEDGKGLTEVEQLQVLDDFLEFVNRVKKNTKSSPISTTETSPSTPLPPEEPPPQWNDSDSGSTAVDPSTELPGPWPSESQPLSA